MSADKNDTLGFPSLPPRADAPASEQPRSGPDDQSMARATLGAANVAPRAGADWAEQEWRARDARLAEQRQVAAINADTVAHRSAGMGELVCRASFVGAGGLMGFLWGGPIGWLFGSAAGYVADHWIGR